MDEVFKIMPFSPVEKNWRSQREMIVLENGIEYYQVNEYKNREWNRYKFTKYKDAIIKFRDLRKEGNRKVLIFGCWKDFCTGLIDRKFYRRYV